MNYYVGGELVPIVRLTQEQPVVPTLATPWLKKKYSISNITVTVFGYVMPLIIMLFSSPLPATAWDEIGWNTTSWR